MVFGAYPQQRERMSLSLERPLLDKAGPSSEASEDLEYKPKSYFLPRYGRNSRPSRCLSPLIVLAIGTGILILEFQVVLLWKLWRQPGHPEVLGEVNGLVPLVGTDPRLFAPDPNFDPLNASDPRWERVMPMGGGFVPIQDWHGKALPEPIHTHGKDLYNVAVFHQLHCLHMLAEEFGNLLAGRHVGDTTSKRAGHSGHEGSMGEEMDEGLMMWHIRHCFEYIKTSLTCCADTALEGQKSDTEQPATDGFGAYHVCRNFDGVFNWAETHRASDQTGYPHGTA